MEGIEQCTTMTALRMEGNTLGIDAAEAMSKALAKHPEFQVINKFFSFQDESVNIESFTQTY